MILGGRGSGKTRAGAEWVRALALGERWALPQAISHGGSSATVPASDEPLQIALVAQTYHDAREVMVEGVSGILAVHAEHERPQWLPSRRRLQWPDGTTARLYSAEDAEALRGPQFHAAWCDELGKWGEAEAAFANLQFALRLGRAPCQLITTTPRPTKLLQSLLARKDLHLSHANTMANAAHLAPNFLGQMLERYGGSRLGRQELEGELLTDREDALFLRSWIEQHRCKSPPPLVRVVVAIDPPATSGPRADACGIIAAGQGADGQLYVLADHSAARLRPAAWAARALQLLAQVNGDALIAEANQGGEMVQAVIHQLDPAQPVTLAYASKSKQRRAEPIALLYEQGRVHHTQPMPELEDELCGFGADGTSNGHSPDRMDALVWALSELAFRKLSRPRARSL